MKYLITGGCGFAGSNCATKVISEGHELFVMDNLSRFGAYQNLEWLKSIGDFQFHNKDIRNSNDVEKLIKEIKPDVIFHLAGQVAMTTSIDNPRLDFETNVLGTFNLLESVRLHSPYSIVIYSSTNKVYGDLENMTYEEGKTRYKCLEYPKGFPESISLNFESPYGCSKGSADQYLLDYNKMFDLQTVVFRHSTMFGGRQFATFDQGWIGWFVQKAIEIESGKVKDPFTINGNGKQVRDVLYTDDVIDLYFLSPEKIDKIKGQAFNIGGSFENSLSLIELFEFLESELDIEMKYQQLEIRKSDQKVFIADLSKAKEMIQWSPKSTYEDGLRKMIEWTREIQ